MVGHAPQNSAKTSISKKLIVYVCHISYPLLRIVIGGKERAIDIGVEESELRIQNSSWAASLVKMRLRGFRYSLAELIRFVAPPNRKVLRRG